jgi:hypothetical protein
MHFLFFHDDNPCILKEIKSFLKTNRYEIHFKWAIINSLLWMISEIKGKMVISLLNCIYITYHSIESSWTNYYHFQSCKINWVGQLFLFVKWVASSFKKVTQRWWGLVFPWIRMIFYQISLTLIQWRSQAKVSHLEEVRRCMCPHWGLLFTWSALLVCLLSTWTHPLVCLFNFFLKAQIIVCGPSWLKYSFLWLFCKELHLSLLIYGLRCFCVRVRQWYLWRGFQTSFGEV